MQSLSIQRDHLRCIFRRSCLIETYVDARNQISLNVHVQLILSSEEILDFLQKNIREFHFEFLDELDERNLSCPVRN
jgi:hypothetical protein